MSEHTIAQNEERIEGLYTPEKSIFMAQYPNASPAHLRQKLEEHQEKAKIDDDQKKVQYNASFSPEEKRKLLHLMATDPKAAQDMLADGVIDLHDLRRLEEARPETFDEEDEHYLTDYARAIIWENATGVSITTGSAPGESSFCIMPSAKGFMSTAVNSVKYAANSVVDFAKDAYNSIEDTLEAAAKTVANGLEYAVDGAADFVKDVYDTTKTTVGYVAGAVKSTIKKGVKAAGELASDVAEGIGNVVGTAVDAGEKALNAVEDFRQEAVKVTEGYIAAGVEVASDAAEYIGEAASGAWDGITSFASSLVGEDEPEAPKNTSSTTVTKGSKGVTKDDLAAATEPAMSTEQNYSAPATSVPMSSMP